jgi:beta-lactam-binding protein with PASTA domain/predicted Ser/Thr protein kinase
MVRDVPRDTVIDGRYRVIERVGSGGMADVYCAEDEQLGRKVALKMLHRRFAEDREFVERFRREASSAAGLQHPNVVGVFDRGEWDGTSYIAMEYLPGRTLKQLIIEEAPLEPTRAIDLAVQILRAARFAHKRGIIHRDLKPHNVIVDDDDRAKVTDFGIARAGASDMTQTGSIMGTAQYLSPEQAQGHAVTPQSDLYSIGICLYEMLTGRLPFDGESAVTIALKQVNAQALPPASFNRQVTPELEGVVMQALAKDPARRFADADAFILALEQAREHIVRNAPESLTAAFVAIEEGPPTGPLAVAAQDGDGSARRWWIALLVAILVLAGAGAAYALTRPAKHDVPNVTGKPVQAALAILQNAGFDPSVQRIASTTKKDTVVRQDPQPGTRAQEGDEVQLTVSDGPGNKAIPDVGGQPRSQAIKALKAAGFKVDEQRQNSDSVKTGRVISTTPGALTQAEVGSTVIVLISSGREKAAVPNVVGQDVSDARDVLTAAGFTVSAKEQEDDTADPGTVLSQSPKDGAQAPKGSRVALVVAKQPKQVTVPDVTGQPVDQAINALADAGLVPQQVSKDVTSADQDGVVLSQNPRDGKADRGSRVVVTVGAYTPPVKTTTTPPVTPTTTTPPAATTPPATTTPPVTTTPPADPAPTP